MKAKLLTFIVLLCSSIILWVGQGYSATVWQKAKPEVRHISEDVDVDKPEGAKDCPKFGPYYEPSRVAPGGTNYLTTCEDIFPSTGTIIQHDQIGDTWYDFQHNGSMGRMISVTSSGYRHFSWMYAASGADAMSGPRYVYSNCKNPAGQYVGAMAADGGTNRAGYCNQTHLHTGESVIIYHRTGGTTPWNVTLTLANGLGSGLFDRHWDIPDYITGAPSGQPGLWPKAEVSYDSIAEKDYIHIVMIEGNTACGGPYMIPYERCYLGANDTLVCQCYENNATRTYKMAKNVNGPGAFAPISHLDSSCYMTPMVAVSPVSRRVAVAFLKPANCGDPYSCDYLSDVCWVESMSNGDDWIAGDLWPPPEYNITNYGCGGHERAFMDVSACYDYQDSLHIVYVTAGFDPGNPGYYQPGVARLYHWSKKSGISMIASKIQEETHPGSHNLNIAKMSISVQDPIYHPGGDSVYLYTIWTQFDSLDQSSSKGRPYGNGDLWGCGSYDGGGSWGHAYNLTNTHTPGCAPGTCLSEHWSSLAQNMYDGDLHIQYICDRDPGFAMSGQDYGSTWQDNPVMYLHLTPPPVSEPPPPSFRIVSPPYWYNPPLKIIPGGYRLLVLTLYCIGNQSYDYTAYSDHVCITEHYQGMLGPQDSVTLVFRVPESGVCVDTFINANVVLKTCGGFWTIYLPVQAIVANDYYECPYDPLTSDTLENGVLRLYTNANCQEWIHDIGTFPDTAHEVFFNGGTIIATIRDGDTLVGRYMGDNDQHAGARDKLYTDECNVNWEPDFYMVYTKNIFMHDLNPPMNPKWFWWEMSKQIKLFKNTAPDLYKHLVIKYVTVKRHDPPVWWPEHPAFTGYEDTYIGVAEDMDCPWDTFASQSARNRAGYDAVHSIAWQQGWDYTGAHPEYNNYYCGIALANGGMPGESIVPYGSYNVRNDRYLYPQAPWGWKEGELYRLAADPLPANIQDPDSMVDRSQVFTARKISAGNSPDTSISFTVVMVVAPGGLSQLQQFVDSARAIVNREHSIGGLPAICGDVSGDLVINVGDIVSLISYLYKGGPPPKCPINRGDCNSDGIINIGDILALINYLYRAGSPPSCPGIW